MERKVASVGGECSTPELPRERERERENIDRGQLTPECHHEQTGVPAA